MKKNNPRVRLTRRVNFSSGHRFWLTHLSEDENRKLFGNTAGRYNHGHNYVLDVTVEGLVNEADGMVLNIKDIDALLKTKIISLLDGKSLNDEIPPFATAPPTTENLCLCIWNLLAGKPIRLLSSYVKNWRWDADLLASLEEAPRLPEFVDLVKIRLDEKPGFYVELESEPGRNFMTLTRTYEFAASHRLHIAALSDAENVELFGKCNNRAGHGHNYLLEVTIEGEPDPTTGMIAKLEEIDQHVMSRVVQRYDHKNLNEDIPELKGLNPTSEIVASKIFNLLEGHLPAKLMRIRLQETARNSFEVVAT